MFLSMLKKALLPPLDKKLLATPISVKGKTFHGVKRQPKNFHGVIHLLSYCLMPTHVHLLLKQDHSRVMNDFIRSLSTRYAMYFNKRHGRTGPLLQSPYKAILVPDGVHVLHLSRHIHRKPKKLTASLDRWYSSYADYIGRANNTWIVKAPVMAHVTYDKPGDTYQSFVEAHNDDDGHIAAYTFR